ncbi:hypothetical protein BQ8794_140047 [Mesorhizobium prunaredense]|uniref:Uncharacterized protein n=1 Tax=Mesorhizobium prunaredense TaxID=1631249 RepID=A0A1R3V1X3_9HYPH|nr:hypothetical protein BQ8794_140047 [Mesorhizobium prunaredense]
MYTPQRPQTTRHGHTTLLGRFAHDARPWDLVAPIADLRLESIVANGIERKGDEPGNPSGSRRVASFE